jgi:hypothetical protein
VTLFWQVRTKTFLSLDLLHVGKRSSASNRGRRRRQTGGRVVERGRFTQFELQSGKFVFQAANSLFAFFVVGVLLTAVTTHRLGLLLNRTP